MEPFRRLTARAAPLDMTDVDTDQIIPAAFLKRPRGEGYGSVLFHGLRFDDEGSERLDFVLNQEPFRDSRILVTGCNFGCGSSREAAVYALRDFGIRAVIAPSFGEIFFNNGLRNGLLPVVLPEDAVADLHRTLGAAPGQGLTIDLEAQAVTVQDGGQYRFDIEPYAKHCLLNGIDELTATLGLAEKITAFEERYRDEATWLF